MLLPNSTLVTNILSMVLAPTEIDQGAKFNSEEGLGPEFPAETTVNILFLTA